MKKYKKIHNETRALKQELLEAKHKLNRIESRRLIRIATFLKKFLANPIWGIKNLKQIPGLLRKINVPKPDYAALRNSSTGPQSIYAPTPMLKYPNIKIACIGAAKRFDKVAYAFELSEVEWLRLLEVGIDLVVVDLKKYKQLKKADEWLDLFYQKMVPVVAIAYSTDDKKLMPARKANLVISAEQIPGTKFDMPFVDITEHNPINWKRNHKKPAIVVGDGVFLDYENIRTNNLNPSDLKDIFAAIVDESSFKNDYDFIVETLRLVSCGIPTLVLSSNSSRKASFGKYFPVIIGDKAIIQTELDKLKDEEYREKYSISARRYIHLNRSPINYTEWILERVGIPTRKPGMVSAIVSTNRPENVESAINNVAAQDYPSKEMILVLHGEGFDVPKIQTITNELDFPVIVIERPADSIFGENLNLAVDKCAGEYITKVDDDDYYGPNHYKDLLAAYYYSGSEIVGKWSNWVYLSNSDLTISWVVNREEAFGGHLPGATMFLEASLMKKLRYGRVKRAVDSELYRRLENIGGRLYSTHRYNFVRVRHDAHTYNNEDESFLAQASGKKHNGYDNDISYV